MSPKDFFSVPRPALCWMNMNPSLLLTPRRWLHLLMVHPRGSIDFVPRLRSAMRGWPVFAKQHHNSLHQMLSYDDEHAKTKKESSYSIHNELVRFGFLVETFRIWKCWKRYFIFFYLSVAKEHSKKHKEKHNQQWKNEEKMKRERWRHDTLDTGTNCRPRSLSAWFSFGVVRKEK